VTFWDRFGGFRLKKSLGLRHSGEKVALGQLYPRQHHSEQIFKPPKISPICLVPMLCRVYGVPIALPRLFPTSPLGTASIERVLWERPVCGALSVSFSMGVVGDHNVDQLVPIWQTKHPKALLSTWWRQELEECYITYPKAKEGNLIPQIAELEGFNVASGPGW
jgi:hypothetical protein